MRRTIALWLLGFCLLSPGCTLVGTAAKNLYAETKRHLDNCWETVRERQLADEYLARSRQGCSDGQVSEDFTRGFEDGFADYLHNGGAGLPPPLAPPRYRALSYQSPEGHAAAEQWFEGFREGAAAAQASGLRQYVTVPYAIAPPPFVPPGPPGGPAPPLVAPAVPQPTLPELPAPRRVEPAQPQPGGRPAPAGVLPEAARGGTEATPPGPEWFAAEGRPGSRTALPSRPDGSGDPSYQEGATRLGTAPEPKAVPAAARDPHDRAGMPTGRDQAGATDPPARVTRAAVHVQGVRGGVSVPAPDVPGSGSAFSADRGQLPVVINQRGGSAARPSPSADAWEDDDVDDDSGDGPAAAAPSVPASRHRVGGR